ncbi:MAG: hypothetical protein NTU88_03965 [Armatimonadetes bacterium]|nr:hypothetical protein [Armatimonadota bacterium]
MQDFWRLTSVLIGLTGFTITGYLLLSKGENLLNTVVKAVLVFAVIYIVQNFLGEMLFSVTGAAPRVVVKTKAKPEPKPEAKPEAKREPKPEPAKAAEAKK